MLWGTNFLGSEGTELDLHENLGLRRYECRYEVEARYNIRNNWGLRFSFMPINYRDNHLPANGFYWGYAYFPPATQILTKWDRYIYRYDMVYDWHRSRTAVSSIFAGANIYDDKLTISNAFQRRSRSQGFALVSTGASIEKIIRPIKRATVSMKCKWFHPMAQLVCRMGRIRGMASGSAHGVWALRVPGSRLEDGSCWNGMNLPT
jgi:hypothetical protein